MKVTVLGASGGIGGPARTTSLLLDEDILIDAGTGVGELSLAAMMQVDHVFLTHSHLDHLACLPFMMDSVGAMRGGPVTVHAQEVTLKGLQTHLFNNVLWPDFASVPTPEAPFLRYEVLPVGVEHTLGERKLRSIPMNHTVPAVGYLLSGPGGSLAFSGDTTTSDEFWRVLNACDNLKHVIIETSFLDKDEPLARISKHLCPKLVVEELKKLNAGPQVHITHLMPGAEDQIMDEIARHQPPHSPRRLVRGDMLYF